MAHGWVVTMDWVELIRAGRLLTAGQPSQEALRRAVSTAYYAMVAIATLAGRR